jgi:hypothetical protein
MERRRARMKMIRAQKWNSIEINIEEGVAPF